MSFKYIIRPRRYHGYGHVFCSLYITRVCVCVTLFTYYYYLFFFAGRDERALAHVWIRRQGWSSTAGVALRVKNRTFYPRHRRCRHAVRTRRRVTPLSRDVYIYNTDIRSPVYYIGWLFSSFTKYNLHLVAYTCWQIIIIYTHANANR